MKNLPQLFASTPSNERSLMERFEAAASFMSGCKAGRAQVNTQLRLYGLFKIVTTHGREPTSSCKKVAFWDLEGSAKLKSWQSIWEEMSRKSSEEYSNARASSANHRDEITDPTGILSNNGRNIGLETQMERRMVQLAANEYIQQAKHFGWTEDHLEQAAAHHALPLDGDQRVRQPDGQPNSNAQLNQELEEAITSKGSSQSDDQDRTAIVERDEYGLEIIPSITNLEASTQTKCTSKKTEGHFAQIIGPSVSKPIFNDAAHSNTPLVGHGDNDLDDSQSGYLHDLVLDRDHIQLENYLSKLQTSHPNQFHVILNHYHNGYTAFHLACDQGDIEKVKIFKKNNVDINLKDEFNNLTGIQLAMEAERHPIVEFLSLN